MRRKPHPSLPFRHFSTSTGDTSRNAATGVAVVAAGDASRDTASSSTIAALVAIVDVLVVNVDIVVADVHLDIVLAVVFSLLLVRTAGYGC